MLLSGLQKTLVAEEMDNQQVKIYMLETRTVFAEAVYRRDSVLWRQMALVTFVNILWTLCCLQ